MHDRPGPPPPPGSAGTAGPARKGAALLTAAHPGPSAVVTVVTLGLGVGVGLSPSRLVVLGIAVLAGQLSVGWSNDWLDARRGRDVERADKPMARGEVTPAAVGRAAAISVGVCLVASSLLGLLPALLHVVGVAAGWAYNLRLKATVGSIAAYVVAFGLIPVVVTTMAGKGWPAAWAVAAAASFGAGVHLSNALPDIERDRAMGIAGLPQRLGVGWSLALSVVVLGIGSAAALLGPFPVGMAPTAALVTLATAAVLLVAALLLGRSGRLEGAYGCTVLVGLLVVGGLVASGGRLA